MGPGVRRDLGTRKQGVGLFRHGNNHLVLVLVRDMRGNSVKGGLGDKEAGIGVFTRMNNHLRFFFWHLEVRDRLGERRNLS